MELGRGVVHQKKWKLWTGLGVSMEYGGVLKSSYGRHLGGSGG